MADPVQPSSSGAIETFVAVVQRRYLKIDARFLPLIEPLFMIETHMSFEERLELFRAALTQPIGFVACEIGSYLGASSAFLAAAASLRQAEVHCVDTWNNAAMAFEPAEDTYARFCENTRYFRHFIRIHRGAADVVAQSLNLNLDLLFIDGDHSYEVVTRDLTHYVPKLKVGGMLVLHDFTYGTVRKACEDFFAGRQLVDKGRVHSLQMFQVAD